MIVAALLYLVGLPLWSRAVENRRAAIDRLVTSLVWVALVIAFIPLVSLLSTVVRNGASELDQHRSSPARCATSSARAAASTTPSSAPC